MQDYEDQPVPSSFGSRKMDKSRNSSRYFMNRIEKIRDKKMIFPESTLSKIVFISNPDGNGFIKQNFDLYDVPAHINLEAMLNRINRTCFKQWRDSLIFLQTEPLNSYDLFQSVFGVLIFIVIIVFVFFILMDKTAISQYLAYTFMFLVLVGCMCSVFVIREKRTDINKDLEMVKVIKKELIFLNAQQQQEYSYNQRFTWTCHKDCIWIACEIH